jgi:hypothetical protein
MHVRSPSSRLGYALLVFGICGIASVLLDLDHIVVLVQKGLPITIENLATRAGRPFHIPVLVVLGALCGYRGARLHRLLHGRV